MLVLVCACTCVCIRDLPWWGYIITDQCLCCLASWLIHPLPLDRAFLYSSTSNSLACYDDNIILPPRSLYYHPVPSLILIHRQPTLPYTVSPDFIWAWPKSPKINYLIQLYWRKIVAVSMGVFVCALYISRQPYIWSTSSLVGVLPSSQGSAVPSPKLLGWAVSRIFAESCFLFHCQK